MALESVSGNGATANVSGFSQGGIPHSGKDAPQNSQAAYPQEFYEPYMSSLSKTRLASPIRGLLTLESIPGVLSLLAGKPAEQTFPITSISINVRSQESPSEEATLKIDSESGRISEALQYGPTKGHTDLIAWLLTLQKHYHGRSEHPSWALSVGAGSQDLLYKAFLALSNPGDSVLIEAPVYAGVIPLLVSSGVNMVEVATDGNGINSSQLASLLENWPVGKPYPKYLYTVPYGCNPTGATTSLQRRREVLALSRKYKFLILEDDPYYLLYYGPEPRPTSYFALEAQDGHGTGLVIRFDSLSKVVSSGLRIGFVSGPTSILQAMSLHTASANLQPSSLAQSVTYALLQHWGISGLDAHTKYVSQFYRERRDTFEAALKKHLDGLVEYTSPVSGMFLWFKLLIPPPAHDLNGEGDSSDLIKTKALERGVLALPGTVFFANGQRSAYVRASFSMLDDEKTDEALRRLGEVVREARGET